MAQASREKIGRAIRTILSELAANARRYPNDVLVKPPMEAIKSMLLYPAAPKLDLTRCREQHPKANPLTQELLALHTGQLLRAFKADHWDAASRISAYQGP